MKNHKENFKHLFPAILLIFFVFIAHLSSAQQKGRDYGKFKYSLDSLFSAAETQGFSGTFFIKTNGQVLLDQGYGYADCAQKSKTKPEMFYDIGSITKGVTAAAILKLVQDGKLTLDSKLSGYIKELPDEMKSITVIQLLTHSSGLKDSFGMDEDNSINKEDLIDKVKQSKLLFKAGDSTAYSNTGYTMLAYIIENISGQSYEQYLKNELFEPARIKSMGYLLPKWSPEKMVCGQRDGKPWGSTKDYFGPFGPSPYLIGNGGIISNAGELSLFFDLIIENKLLKPDYASILTSRLSSKAKSGDSVFHISGANNIFSSAYAHWMKNNISFVLFTNNSEYPKEKIEHKAIQIIENFLINDH